MHGFIHLSQTNFQAFTLSEDTLLTLFRKTRAKTCFSILLLITVFLSACSTQPSLKKTKDTVKTTTKAVVAQTAEDKLALAQSLNAKKITTGEITAGKNTLKRQAKITELLIDASELFLQQQNFTKALWLTEQIAKLKQSNHKNSYRLLLVKARSLQALNYHQQAYQQLQLANELVSYTMTDSDVDTLALTLPYYQILTDVLTAQKKLVPALDAELNAFALNSNASNDTVIAIWHKLELLTQWQIPLLVNSNPPFIKGWQQLLNYSHKFGANSEKFTRYLHLWQQRNPSHPAMGIIEQLRTQALTKNNIENVAILLPLSGSQQNAGLAAQHGILAAYKNNTANNLHFIDTNNLDWESIAAQFSELKIDHVIGPLLKPNVDTFLNTTTQHTALQIPTLLLNLASQVPLASFQFALSMKPESEAIQAAATLSQQNYKNPIILSHQDRVSKRIAIAFREQWQRSTGDSVDIVYFNQGKQMQASLKESLDINASQTRIRQLNARLKDTIKAEPRNRRDIDMIYLVGTAAQTRLIKPYIDVNTSPFAQIIPVYASSRSHSDFNDKNNASSINDLQGLTFTQIPWLLNSTQQNKTLTALSAKIWPKRTDSLSSIFAMGFDSYNLLGKVSLMKQAPYIRHFGQTGVLRLNSENILNRSLIWGQYRNDKVMQVAIN